jgi:hypothetical protein
VVLGKEQRPWPFLPQIPTVVEVDDKAVRKEEGD